MKKKYVFIFIIFIILYPLYLGINYSAQLNEPSKPVSDHSNYEIEEYEIKIDGLNLDINIRYPRVTKYAGSSLQDNDLETMNHINALLVPAEILWIHEMVKNDEITISDTGEFVFDSMFTFGEMSYAYSLGIDYEYTMGFSNEHFLNFYERRISYIRNSDWKYGAKLIDMQSGVQIMATDFYDLNSFRECIAKDIFKANFEDFDIKTYFEDMPDESLIRYLGHTFINDYGEIEVIVIYGEGYETKMIASISEAKEMIKPDYLELLGDIF